MWQEQQEMEQARHEWEQQQAEQDMPAHKRTGYFEMMCDMVDHQRKWVRENGK
jgi:hypothetical protein